MDHADHFALLAVHRRRLAVGLLGAAFVGITTAVTALGVHRSDHVRRARGHEARQGAPAEP